ncbi:META domain-containing protein [Hymenobacter taeanensis]|uniref:META domain-containing protein n=1 Tax=Hymenobacter taeanensis TaxID=2735321 RepID=A0A6M6BM07_9BACT|nr:MULTISPECIES: META domain-containing protein [Hymenobacter]QJX48155.1 META domain-containing protein [Hymenobacter taeanensis]UOQ82372.1 META domain-containing protein [Hymenobacter sp. 5414T-23]
MLLFRRLRTSSLILSLLLAGCQSKLTPTTFTPAPPPPATLHTTRWILYRLEAQPVTTTPEREMYVQLSATETQAEGQGGCNRFRGSFQLPMEGKLQFGPLLSTKMACPELALENRFLQVLGSTRSYRISGDTLRLYSEATVAPLAVFLARK